MKYLFIWLIRFYQRFLSPLKRRPTCRFTPTCSAYALEAFMTRGAIVGFILMVTRILRCNPFCPGGWDPVPKTGLRNPRQTVKPMTKYYYPEEYALERDGESQTAASRGEKTDNGGASSQINEGSFCNSITEKQEE